VFDSDPYLLGVPGGVVDLRTGKMREALRTEYVTRSTAVAPRWSEPRLWKKFLAEATGGDVPMQAYLQVMAGYFLTGSTNAHALFFLFGAGKNGKSVFVDVLARVLSDYAVTASMDTFIASKSDRHPTDLARLDGARLVTASETEEGRAWAESRIKQLTGGDRIAARFMRQDFFEFSPVFKLLIAGNFQPQLHNVDEAMRRRFHMIPFTQTPRQPDPQLGEKLQAEYGQILAWAIEGARIWQRKGLTRPDAVVDASDRYFEEQDLFGHWIAERCLQKPGAVGRSVDLFSSWRNFARQNGEEAGTQKAMAGALRKRGFQSVRVSGGARAWQGIELAQVFGESDA
jgi:putative DNA primase/helicase